MCARRCVDGCCGRWRRPRRDAEEWGLDDAASGDPLVSRARTSARRYALHARDRRLVRRVHSRCACTLTSAFNFISAFQLHLCLQVRGLYSIKYDAAGELLLHRPLLPGRSEPQQLELIAQLLGAPNANIWPSLPELLARVPENFALPTQPYDDGPYEYNSISNIFQSFRFDSVRLLTGTIMCAKSSLSYAKRADASWTTCSCTTRRSAPQPPNAFTAPTSTSSLTVLQPTLPDPREPIRSVRSISWILPYDMYSILELISVPLE